MSETESGGTKGFNLFESLQRKSKNVSKGSEGRRIKKGKRLGKE